MSKNATRCKTECSKQMITNFRARDLLQMRSYVECGQSDSLTYLMGAAFETALHRRGAMLSRPPELLCSVLDLPPAALQRRLCIRQLQTAAGCSHSRAHRWQRHATNLQAATGAHLRLACPRLLRCSHRPQLGRPHSLQGLHLQQHRHSQSSQHCVPVLGLAWGIECVRPSRPKNLPACVPSSPPFQGGDGACAAATRPFPPLSWLRLRLQKRQARLP